MTHELFEQASPVNVPSWVAPLRKAAISRFRELGFPTRNDEEWRFTPIAPITDTAFKIAPRSTDGVNVEDLAAFTFGSLDAALLVFVNGIFAPGLSNVGELPAGVTVSSLADAFVNDPAPMEAHLARHAEFENSAFTAMNTAFLEDGAFVHVPRGVQVERPIHLLYVSTTPIVEATISHPRTLIVVEESGQATVLESYAGIGAGAYFTNAVTEVVVGANANVDHVKTQRELNTAYHVATMRVDMGRDSVFRSHSVTYGGAIARNDVNAYLGGEHIECTLNGLYLADGKRLVDNHTAIDHATPNCASHELYKGILNDAAHGVFNGKIFVRLDAQKTDAKQTNKTLLLSDDATINTKPQLEIFADDVKCTHGATVGQLDAEALFYLRSRGIGVEQARAILIHAFARDVLDRINVEAVRESLEEALYTLLPHA